MIHDIDTLLSLRAKTEAIGSAIMLAVLGLFSFAIIGMAFVPYAREEHDSDDSDQPIEDDGIEAAPVVHLPSISLDWAIEATAGNDALHGTDGPDQIGGEGGDDYLDGGDDDDGLFGGIGRDELHGGQGNDLVEGGEGDDDLYGSEGDDRLSGSEGNDDLVAGDGSDLLEGGAGVDQMLGGPGDDTLSGQAGADILNGGPGNDVLDGLGDTESDFINGGSGDDLLIGSAGDNLHGGGGTDRFALMGQMDLPVVVEDYTPGADTLIVLNASAVSTSELTTVVSGGGISLLWRGTPIAFLPGTVDLDINDVHFVKSLSALENQKP